jgi:hypothetical protein
MAGNPQWQEIGANPIKTMDVYWDGNLLASPEANVTGHTISNMGWQYYEFEAMASSSATRRHLRGAHPWQHHSPLRIRIRAVEVSSTIAVEAQGQFGVATSLLPVFLPIERRM